MCVSHVKHKGIFPQMRTHTRTHLKGSQTGKQLYGKKKDVTAYSFLYMWVHSCHADPCLASKVP